MKFGRVTATRKCSVGCADLQWKTLGRACRITPETADNGGFAKGARASAATESCVGTGGHELQTEARLRRRLGLARWNTAISNRGRRLKQHSQRIRDLLASPS